MQEENNTMLILMPVLVLSFIVGASADCMQRVCFFANWAQHRPTTGRYTVENIDPLACTHLVYSYAKIQNNHLTAVENNDEDSGSTLGGYSKFNRLKLRNPQLKTLIAVGGWKMDTLLFTNMVVSRYSRKDFIDHAIQFMRRLNFDGLDIRWQYPGSRGSPAIDKLRFTFLLQELRDAFEEEAATTGNNKLLLTASVAAVKEKIDGSYEIGAVARELDMVNIMSYNYHGAWDNYTGHNSPLYAHSEETGNARFMNMNFSMNYYAQNGAPKEKINVGLVFFGRSFTLDSTSDKGVMAKAKGASTPGRAGSFTREAGKLSYYEICGLIHQEGSERHMIEDQKVPYIVKGDQWIGYDDTESLRNKVRAIQAQGFGGIMISTLDMDDFQGICNQGLNLLLNAVNDECKKTITSVESRSQPRTTTQPPIEIIEAPTYERGWPIPGCPNRVCIVPSWSQHRSGIASFKPENVDPVWCTHVVYAFAEISNGRLAPVEWNDEASSYSIGNFRKLTNLKYINPHLKTLLAVGGFDKRDWSFVRMASTAVNRKKFIDHAIFYLRRYNFDGLDIVTYALQKYRYSIFIQEIQAAFKKEAKDTGEQQLLLSISVPASKEKIDRYYDIRAISREVDMINLYSFDYQENLKSTTEHPSPLYRQSGSIYNNMNFSMNYLVSKGAPRYLINVGLSTYGRSFTLRSTSKYGVGAPASGPGTAGRYTGEPGFLSYYEVCDVLKTLNKVHRVSNQREPYVVKGNQWIGYEDAESLANKVRFIRRQSFGGVMIYNLALDDFTGRSCYQGVYPLLTAIVLACDESILGASHTTSGINSRSIILNVVVVSMSLTVLVAIAVIVYFVYMRTG